MADQRSLATGLESYYVDNNKYPLWAAQNYQDGAEQLPWPTLGWGHCNGFSGTGTGASTIHSFAVRTGTGTEDLFFMLTTPISYMSSFLPDPFADTKGSCYAYYAQKAGWILYSFGPDVDEAPHGALGWCGDIDLTVETLYNYRISQPTTFLITGNGAYDGAESFTYDPTNGTASAGDVWRVKQ